MAEVFRDALGVPHVSASGVLDLARAHGEVTARDRGWQIEVDRLRAEGRLSSLIGEAGLAWDVFARRARLDDTARRAFASSDDEARAFVAAYAGGVRDGMSKSGCLAREFAQLDGLFGDRFTPAPWPDHAPLGVLHVAHALFSPFPAVLWREHVRLTLGEGWVALFGRGEDEPAPTSGSNGWALHGSRTASGLPVLAGDPHRMFELPGVYQQVRLACDEFDVVGLAFPGVPGIPHFAHAGDAAWGVTNAMAHSVEVFRERLRRDGEHVEALGPDGWREASVVRSVIRVRGGTSVEAESIETERGTVVTDLRAVDGGSGELMGWSVRMPARTDADLGANALLPLLRARTAHDVIAAFGRWIDPVNRVLTADRHGTVLSATVGAAPALERDERRLPRDGARVRPVEDRRMPPARVIDDVTVDANERPRTPEIDFGWRYASGHRAKRIIALLGELFDEHRPATTEDFEPVWGDTLIDAGPLLGLLPDGELDPASTRLRDELRGWDRRMNADSPAAGGFAAWRGALARRVAAHPVLAPLGAAHGFGAVFDPWFAVVPQLSAVLPQLLAHPALAADADALTRDALTEAAASAPPSWGREHRMLPLHVLADVPGATAPVIGLDVAVSGDDEAVRCTGSSPGLTHRAWRGSVARWAWDLADRERSRWSVPFGASGDPASPHFGDQLADWAAVRTSAVVTDWNALLPDADEPGEETR